MSHADIRCFFPCIGLGVGARGFQRAKARMGRLVGEFRVIGGVDNDERVIANAERYLNARLTVVDLFSRGQYIAFHGHEPPDGWREATPADIRRAAGYEFPNIVFTSSPCKGYSGLTSETRSQTPKYQALNELALRSIFLTLEAFAENPPEFWLMENVPRIISRGAPLLHQIQQLLAAYGYALATAPNLVHDCGELGNLAQSRKRFLLVARHREKVPNFLYQPVRRPLRAVGDVLGRLPLPDHVDAGPLHRLPSLSWKTWVRLAFVEAGKDWRSLNRLAVEAGYLRDYALAPEVGYRNGVLGVTPWTDSAGTIAGENLPTNGKFSVADPRWDAGRYDCMQYGVRSWEEPTGTVIAIKSPGQGTFAVADPRFGWAPGAHENKFRVVRWGSATGPIIGTNKGPGSGAAAVADPRGQTKGRDTKYKVALWDGSTRSVIGASTTGEGAFACADPRLPDSNPNRQNGLYRVDSWDSKAHAVTGAVHSAGGAQAVADPRPGLQRGRGSDYLTAGHYGVVPWSKPAYAVTGTARHDNGHGNVADPRLPSPDERLRCLIVAEDGTWHRPFTTMENAALQSIFDPEEYMHFTLFGGSDQLYREWIGNAAPRDAMTAIAEVIGQALLLAWSGETQIVGDGPIWVQPIIAAIQCGETNLAAGAA